MDIEKLARKLEPLMPKEVRHWMQIRDVADPDLKSLLEKQIVTMAAHHLGDYRNKILLSLPSKKKAQGTFRLGKIIYEEEKWPVGISAQELLQNLAIFGRSGAGKTNVAFQLLTQLADQKIPFLFLDWKRTARHLIPHLKGKINIFTPGRSISPFPFNPFIVPPGLDESVYINLVVDIMGDAYTLGDGAKNLLNKAVAACYKSRNLSPTVENILDELDKMPLKERAQGWKISAVRALETLATSGIASQENISQQKLIQTLLQENTIVELDGLSQGGKKFLIPLLCLWIYYTQLASAEREQLKSVIFLEEAHHILYRHEQRSKESVMNMLLRQCREIGIAMVVVDQHPHLISSAALGNCYTSICLNQKDPTDINKAAALSLVEDSDKKYFSMLPVGEGIVKLQDRWRKPFLVKFPLVNINKGAVTDEILKGYLNSSQTSWSKKRLADSVGYERLIDYSGKFLEGDAFRLLEDVTEHPDDGVKERYHRLEISVGRGNRIKEELIKQGWLNSEIIKVGKSRKTLLQLTKTAKDSLGLENKTPERGSLVHEYWKRFYADKLKNHGYSVKVEAPRRNGFVDLEAEKEGTRIAVEIETGKSDFISNVKNNLLEKYDKIYIVATDNKALEKINRHLTQANLIFPDKLKLILKDQFPKELFQ